MSRESGRASGKGSITGGGKLSLDFGKDTYTFGANISLTGKIPLTASYKRKIKSIWITGGKGTISADGEIYLGAGYAKSPFPDIFNYDISSEDDGSAKIKNNFYTYEGEKIGNGAIWTF